MNKSSFFKPLALAAAVSTALLTAHAALAADAADITIDGSGVMITPIAGDGFTVMNVRIVDPDGFLIVDHRSQGEDVSWVPGVDDPDGDYSYEAVVVSGDESTEDGESIERHTGSFSVEGGIVKPEQIPGPPVSQVDENPGLFGQVAGAVLDFLVPSAHAVGGLNHTNSGPSLVFNDTDTAGDEWGIYANQSFFGTYDWEDNHYIFLNYTSGTTGLGARSIEVQADGDIGFANFGMFFDRSATRLGIGTTSPAVDLQINDSRPEFRFLDETDSGVMDLVYDGGNFAIEGNTGQNIVLLSEIAPGNSITVDSAGDVGIGKSSAIYDLDVFGGQLFLDHGLVGTGDPGDWRFNPGGTGLFLINQDSSSTTPIKFYNNAPSNSLVMRETGLVGLGTTNPASQLHILGSANNTAAAPSTTSARIENVSGLVDKRYGLQLVNNGASGFYIQDTSNGTEWQFATTSTGHFTASALGTGGSEFMIRDTGEFIVGPGGTSKLRVDPAGNGFFAGQVVANGVILSSDRNLKQNFREIDPSEILAKVNEMDITRWNFKAQNPEVDHIGPMAQDFYKAFGTGQDDKHISPMDMASVALAAVKGLQQELDARDAQLAERDARIAALESSQVRVEAMLQALVAGNNGLALPAAYTPPQQGL